MTSRRADKRHKRPSRLLSPPREPRPRVNVSESDSSKRDCTSGCGVTSALANRYHFCASCAASVPCGVSELEQHALARGRRVRDGEAQSEGRIIEAARHDAPARRKTSGRASARHVVEAEYTPLVAQHLGVCGEIEARAQLRGVEGKRLGAHRRDGAEPQREQPGQPADDAAAARHLGTASPICGPSS
jgi:hypothetical protein